MDFDLDTIRDSFEFFDDWEDKYKFIIDLGKALPDLADEYKIETNRIHGCQSQVWITHSVSADGTMNIAMDSDAFIVRGLIAIVQAAYADKQPAQILETDIDALFGELDLLSHLSMTRGNGLRAMIERIRSDAAQLRAASD